MHAIGAESLLPVPAGEGRLFLKIRQDASVMLRLVSGADGRTTVETLWTAPVLRTTYVVPVYHRGFLYGMNGRSTLTCVDAATGEVRWRSREPGDGFPLLVGDDLVILTKEKTLHVGPASPEGWKERARLDLFHDLVWSPPSFADGAFFARSQGEVARIDWREARAETPGPIAAAEPAPTSRVFARLLADLAATPDKGAVVDRFLASIPPGPLVEWPDRVVFLYRGVAKDVGIAGDMIGDRREDPMRRVPGTDLFWYESVLEPDARISYHFVRDFDERLPRSPQPVARPRPADRDAGDLPDGAVVARHARLARPRSPRVGSGGAPGPPRDPRGPKRVTARSTRRRPGVRARRLRGELRSPSGGPRSRRRFRPGEGPPAAKPGQPDPLARRARARGLSRQPRLG